MSQSILDNWNVALAVVLFVRRGFYVAAVPVAVKGMFGPGAPHVFLLQRRCDTGPYEKLSP